MNSFKIFILNFIFASTSFATVTITGISGASHYTQPTATDTAWTVFGGIQGLNYSAYAATCGGSSGPCNTCIGANAANGGITDGACNPAGVFVDTAVVLNATTTVATAVGSKWLLCNSTTEVGSTNSTGKDVMRSITWLDLCTLTTAGGSAGNTDCGTAMSATTLSLGYGADCTAIGAEKASIKFLARKVDPSIVSNYTDCPEGAGAVNPACHFALFPGDEKVYIESSSFYTGTAFPSITGASSGITWSGIYFFFLEVPGGTNDGDTFAAISNDLFEADGGAMSSSVIPVSGTDALDGSLIDGLNNDSRYCFRMANQDTAKNIEFFTPTTLAASATSTTGCAIGTPLCDEVCMTPSEVVGILSDKHCFVATAAFGSDMDKHVQMLRKFRNQFMAPFWIGRKLVKAYYKISPPLAEWISHHEKARTLARAMLWPIMGWAELTLKFGWIILIAPFLMFAFGFQVLRRFNFHRRIKNI